LLVEDVCTSSVSKNLHFSFRKPFHVSVCENACASSPTPTLHVFTAREAGSLSGVRVHFASVTRGVSPFEEPPQHRKRICPRTSGPAKLARFPSARAALETLDSDRDLVKRFVERAQKKFKNLALLGGHIP